MSTVAGVSWRLAQAALHTTVWLSLLLAGEVADSRWLVIPFVLGVGYPAMLTYLLMSRSRREDALGAFGFIAGLLAAAGGLMIAFGLPSWYVERHGATTQAVVTEHRCVDSDRTDCGPQYRVTAVASGEDLGWASCLSGRWEDGATILVRADRLGLFRPELRDCGDDPFPPAPIVAASLAAGVLAFTLASFATWGAAPRSAGGREPAYEELQDPPA